jgi:hypothetical protein
MSEFPEIQPFGPRPAPHDGDPQSKEAVAQPDPAATAASPIISPIIEEPATACGKTVHVGLILAGVAAGFALGYVMARYQELLIRESRLEELIDSTEAWIREQGPKIADPIRHGLESAGTTWDQAFKKVRSRPAAGAFSFFRR